MPQSIIVGDLPDEALRGTLEHVLAARRLLPMPAALEARYEARRGAARRHRMSRALVVIGAVCLAMPGLEVFMSWPFALHALPLRVLVSALCFGGAFLLGGVRAGWQESTCVLVPLLAAMAVTQALGEVAPERFADRYLIVAPMIVAAFVATVPLSLATAGLLCVTGVVCALLVAAASSGQLGLLANWDIIAFASGVMGVAMAVAHRNELSRRRSFLFGLRHELSAQEMNLLNAKLLRLSATDMLTGLANRRQFEMDMERAWLDRRGTDLGVALIDVDHFKLFNDSAGHAAGDACLRAVATAVEAALRHPSDRAARYGGEEFVILLPGIAAGDLPILGERLRRAVEELALPHPGQNGAPVTISVGLAWSAGTARAGTPDTLLRAADRAMYFAKHSGRNRVGMAGALDMAAE